MYGLFIILLFYFLGNLISELIGGFIPGSVIGMVFLFFSLLLKLVNPEKVKPVANFITGHMALYFIPVGVGMMVSIHYLSHIWPVIVLASIVSMVLVMVSTGWAFQIIKKWIN